jgi:hypothetical protein
MDWDQVSDVLEGWKKYPPATVAIDGLTRLVCSALGGEVRDG